MRAFLACLSAYFALPFAFQMFVACAYILQYKALTAAEKRWGWWRVNITLFVLLGLMLLTGRMLGP
jgi:hypothetical protein